MLVDLGLSVYAEDFEKPFLTTTAEFYMVRTVLCAMRSQYCVLSTGQPLQLSL